ncbi:MAG: hypothetical protein ACEQSC_01245 [Candidatus Nanopelagicaceae bacterium]
MIVFLDTNILGLITNRNTAFDESQQCKKWFETLLIRGVRIVTSDICDYEVRRGLISSTIRSGQVSPGIGSLDSLRIDGLLEFLISLTLKQTRQLVACLRLVYSL